MYTINTTQCNGNTRKSRHIHNLTKQKHHTQ